MKRFPSIKAYTRKEDKFVKSAHKCFLKYKIDMADMKKVRHSRLNLTNLEPACVKYNQPLRGRKNLALSSKYHFGRRRW